jgi:hypothetical protein
VHLKRRDDGTNLARFYVVQVAPTLFGAWAVVREWGRIGAPGRVREDWHPSHAERVDGARDVGLGGEQVLLRLGRHVAVPAGAPAVRGAVGVVGDPAQAEQVHVQRRGPPHPIAPLGDALGAVGGLPGVAVLVAHPHSSTVRSRIRPAVKRTKGRRTTRPR